MENKTNDFASYIIDIVDNLPDKVVKKAKQCVTDYLGCAIAGSKVNKDNFEKGFYNQGKCDIFGYDTKTDSKTASFINGFNGHTVELDDGSRFGMIHLGACIIPAVIASAQENDIDYSMILKGVVAGYEASVRMSLAMQPSHKKRGFHTTGTCGTIGAAIAVAIAMGCTHSQLVSTISSAATSSAGLLEIQENASTLKPYNAGHAAMAGLNAAYIGMMDFCAPDDILFGTRGFIRLFSDTINVKKLCEKTDYFEIERIYVKPYAACRHCHSAIEAILELRKNNISVDNINRIQVNTYSMAVLGHDHTEIKGISSAKLSIPYSVALSYIVGDCGINDFTEENLNNQEILDLTKRVIVDENPEFSSQSSKKRIAEVTIYTNDGRYFSHRVDYAKGDPENPIIDYDLENKFRSLLTWSGFENVADSIINKVYN